MESKEKNKQNRNRLIDTENRLMVTRGEGGWEIQGKELNGLTH